jgi:GIY-YIG catalytic domain
MPDLLLLDGREYLRLEKSTTLPWACCMGSSISGRSSIQRATCPPRGCVMSRWVTIHPFDSIGQFATDAAVYVIFDDSGKVLYVGESINLRARFRQHNFTPMRYSNTFRCPAWGPCGDLTIKVSYSKKFGEKAFRERRLIRRLKPQFNRRPIARVLVK